MNDISNFQEICAICSVTKSRLGRCFRMIIKKMETSVTVPTTADFMSRFCSSLSLPENVLAAADRIAQKAVDLDLVLERSPLSIAAAAIFMASQV